MPVTGIILGLGGLQAGLGVLQSIKAGKIARNNIAPNYDIPSAFTENQRLATADAQTGFSGEARQNLNEQANVGLGSALNADTTLGANPNNISDTLSAFVRGLSKNAIEDSQLKEQKMQNLYGINNTLGGQQQQQYIYNQLLPYLNKAQLSSLLSTQGTQNIFGGLDTAGAGLIGTKTTNSQDDFFQKLIKQFQFGTGSGTSSSGDLGYSGGGGSFRSGFGG